VNAQSGVDDLCCGRSATTGILGGPCETITHGLKQVQANAWTINFVGDASGNASPNEVYPIELSGGVYVVGQGATSSYVPGTSGKAVFEVATDSIDAHVNNLTMGTRADGKSVGATYGMYIHGGGYGLIGYANVSQVDQGVYVGPSSSFYGVGGITSTRIGLNLDGGQFGYSTSVLTITGASQDGIHCESVTSPTTASGSTSIEIEAAISGSSRYGLYAGHGCSITCGSSTFGPSTCQATRPDGVGVYVEGTGFAYLQSAVVSCMNGDGAVAANNVALSGTPTLTIDGTTVRNNGGAGVRGESGTVTVFGSTVTANHWGAIQQSGATGSVGIVNLAGYNATNVAAPNTFYCNGKTEPGAYCTPSSCPNGANVWNNSALPLAAKNDYWANSPLTKCSCSNALASCTCSGGAAGDTTPPDVLDVLVSPYTSGGAVGLVDTTGYLPLTNKTCSY
jgi:hypothetical protein